MMSKPCQDMKTAKTLYQYGIIHSAKAILPALACFLAVSATQAQTTPPTLYYNTSTGHTLNGSTYWSPTISPLQAVNWTNGDYAYLGVPGASMPTGVTWGSIETPGVTFNGQGVSTTVTIHGSTLKMDSDPNGHAGFMTMFMSNSATIWSQNSGTAFYKPDPTPPAGLSTANGMYVGGDGTGNMWLGDAVQTFTGGLWIGEGAAVVITSATALPNNGSMILGDQAVVANGQYAILRVYAAGFSGTGSTYTINYPVTISGNVQLLNGSGDGHLAFAGGMYLAGVYNICNNANTANFNSTISGPGGFNFGPTLGGGGWSVMSLNANNTYSGGTTINAPSPVTANSPGALGTGNVTVYSGTAPQLVVNYANTMSPEAVLDIEGNTYGTLPASGIVALNYSGTQYVSGLIIAGVAAPAGIYGTGPNATQANPNNAFSGTGYIDVLPGIRITSETFDGHGNVTLCWSSAPPINNTPTYNVLATVGLGQAASWTTVNANPVQSQGSSTCYTFSTNSGQQFFVIKQPDPNNQ